MMSKFNQLMRDIYDAYEIPCSFDVLDKAMHDTMLEAYEERKETLNECPVIDRGACPAEWSDLVEYHSSAKRVLPKPVRHNWD